MHHVCLHYRDLQGKNLGLGEGMVVVEGMGGVVEVMGGRGRRHLSGSGGRRQVLGM